jgi:uncharacterized membrane protein
MAELDKHRLFKLVRGVVLVVALFSIGLGIYILSYSDQRQDLMTKKCNMKTSNPDEDIINCGIFIKNSEEGDANGFRSLGLGASILIVFFSGVGVYKYLYRKQ